MISEKQFSEELQIAINSCIRHWYFAGELDKVTTLKELLHRWATPTENTLEIRRILLLVERGQLSKPTANLYIDKLLERDLRDF